MEFADYIGIPWQSGAEGPEAYNCATFARHLQRAHFSRELPPLFGVDEHNLRAVCTALGTGESLATEYGWHPVAQPRHGDIALLARASHPSHIGVWLDIDGGGIIHCLEQAGVIFSTPASLRLSGWGKIIYYTCRA